MGLHGFVIDRATHRCTCVMRSPQLEAAQSRLLEIMPLCWQWGETHSLEDKGDSLMKRTVTRNGTPCPLSTFSLELFAAPVLKASLSSPFPEGSLVILNCETTLFLQSPGSQLYFSFYVGSKILEDRNTSSEYHIPRAEREDSGLYWCEVATGDRRVLKRSPELELQVLGECERSGDPFPSWGGASLRAL